MATPPNTEDDPSPAPAGFFILFRRKVQKQNLLDCLARWGFFRRRLRSRPIRDMLSDRVDYAVPKADKILDAVLRGTSDANIAFAGLRSLLLRLGFQERIKGSHHILWREGVAEILNLQPKRSKAKPYQVKQVRVILLKYKLGGEPDAEI